MMAGPPTVSRESGPIVVLGAPRSGTSYVAELIASQPDISLLMEPRLTWRRGQKGRSDFRPADDAETRSAPKIRRDMRKRALRQGTERFVEKTPSNSLRVDFVSGVFPDAKFVHVCRDPMDAIASMMGRWKVQGKGFHAVGTGERMARRIREVSPSQVLGLIPEFIDRAFGIAPMWGPRLPGMRALVRELPLVAVAALQWRACVEGVLQSRIAQTAERIVHFSIESLTQNDIDYLGQFVSLSDPASLLAQFSATYSPPQKHVWDDDGEREVAAALVAPTLEWLHVRTGIDLVRADYRS